MAIEASDAGSQEWLGMTQSSAGADLAQQLGRRKSKRMVNITATLPLQLLDRIDELVESDKVPSRSHLIREAVESLLKELE